MRKLIVLCLAGLIAWIACYGAMLIETMIFDDMIFPLSVLLGLAAATGFLKIAVERGWTAGKHDEPETLFDNEGLPQHEKRHTIALDKLVLFASGRQMSFELMSGPRGHCKSCSSETVFRVARKRSWFALFSMPAITYRTERFLVCPVCSQEVRVKPGLAVS